MSEKFFVLYQFSYDRVVRLEAKERRDLLPSRKVGRDEESGGYESYLQRLDVSGLAFFIELLALKVIVLSVVWFF